MIIMFEYDTLMTRIKFVKRTEKYRRKNKKKILHSWILTLRLSD